MRNTIRILCASLIALFASASLLAADNRPTGLAGLGVYGSLGRSAGDLGGGIGVTFKRANFPVVGLQYNVEDDSSRFNASVDYLVLDGEPIGSLFGYFIGAGLYGGAAATGDNETDFDFGLRFPFGLQFWPIRKLEFYLSPVLSVPLYPTPTFGGGVELGGRLYF